MLTMSPSLSAVVARDAVAHDMVDRDAAALGIAAVAERRGHAAAVERHPVDDVVELLGGDAGNDVRHERVEDLGGEPAGAAHALERFGAVELDHAVARFDAVVGGDSDVLSHGRHRHSGKPNRSPELVERLVFCEVRNVRSRLRRASEPRLMRTAIWTAALVVIGDEILSGRTQDNNVAQVATWLNDQGIRLAEVRVVPDDMRADRRGGERAARGARLSVHDRRDRPDPRRHHGRRDRRGVRRAGGRPSRGAADAGGLLSRPAGRPDRGAAADGARARRAPS